MTVRRTAIALGMTVLACGLAAGPATRPASTGSDSTRPAGVTAAATDPAVAGLIRDLDADDPAARDAAGDRLIAKGEAVRAAVADAAAHSDSPEVRGRAAAVLARLDEAVADRPTTVTLHAKALSPRDLFVALGKQGAMPVTFLPDDPWMGRQRKLSIDWSDKPFWDAVDEACHKAGADVRPSFSGAGLMVTAGAGTGLLGGPRAGAGRLLLVAGSYTHVRSVSYADNAQSGSDRLAMVALLDPKLQVVDGTGPDVTVTEATDDTGGSLAPPPPAGFPGRQGGRAVVRPSGGFRGPGGGPICDLVVELKPAPAAAKRIVALKGTVAVQVVGRADRLVIDDAGHAGQVTRTVGPFTVDLVKCDLTETDVTYELNIRSADGDPAAFAGGFGRPDVRLEDADGREVTGNSNNRMGGGNGQVHLTTHISTHGDPIRGPVRLVWTVATKTKVVAFPFEFHDLDLPQP